jgi:hypothetical protein
MEGPVWILRSILCGLAFYTIMAAAIFHSRPFTLATGALLLAAAVLTLQWGKAKGGAVKPD